MTASATPSSSQTAPANGNQAMRQSSGSAASSKTNQSSQADFFSSLLGLLSASGDGGLPLGGEGLADGSEPEDPNALLLADATALGNPLADLIGWPGATAATPATQALSSGTTQTGSVQAQLSGLSGDLPEGQSAQSGLALQGMTVLAEPVAADPNLVSGLKNPTAASNTTSPQGNPLSAAAASAAANTPADRDAASVSYGDASESKSEATAANASRNGAYMAARPANWRSTTALSSSGPTAALSSSASTQTAAIQVAQHAATQRGAMADPLLPAARNTAALGERFSASSLSDAATAELGAVATTPGQAAKGHADSSGNGRDETLLAGATVPEPGDTDAPEETFSLDAALASEEELEGTEFMNPQQLRNASVRVGEGTDEAIDIRLSLEGEAINVDFRTDNAEVRAGLQQNAGASLSELMQRGGIQLGGVSVGAQSQQGRDQAGSSESNPSRVGGANGRNPSAQGADGTSDAATAQRPAVARRSDGGPALDVFA